MAAFVIKRESRRVENSAQTTAGNAVTIVHTQAAFNTKVGQVAPQKRPPRLGEHVREDE
jgi:hypothetical protein